MMIKLKKIEIEKYKCFETPQCFDVESDITILVGLNESGKTSVLEAIAKTNYFNGDSDFKYNSTHDYPKKEKKKMDRSEIDPIATTCTYEIQGELIELIKSKLNGFTLPFTEVSISYKYSNESFWGNTHIDCKEFFDLYGSGLYDLLKDVSDNEDFNNLLTEKEEDISLHEKLKLVSFIFNGSKRWDNRVSQYVFDKYIYPNLPKYLYYDEYYSLPSRISIEKLQEESLSEEDLKTAKALFELSDINIEQLISSKSYEDFKSELEATSADISDDLFEFWSTNKNLEIQFDIDKRIEMVDRTTYDQHKRPTVEKHKVVVEHILDIRVRNNRARITLPLKNRSKGFNWFFSFFVWFKKIQEDQNSNYILLLDEPGLNLHAAAQKNLLDFLESLTGNYQIVYTTHSPFMIPSEKLRRVRTVLETESGSNISDSLQEKDPNTLFPLQAALGYDIAQNLYISKNNLLVEGVSDLIYLELFSAYLRENKRTALRDDITIVPVGGLDKIATFVSLLRSNDLNLICLLDSSIKQSNKEKLGRHIEEKIIREKNILNYKDFIEDAREADIEDVFEPNDYINIFNDSFGEHKDFTVEELEQYKNLSMVNKINKHLSISRFNHYKPANFLAQKGIESTNLDPKTIDRFEDIFKRINSLI